MTNFTGNLNVSGTIYANGTPEVFSGTIGITLSANLNAQGTGTGSETVNGTLNYSFTYHGHQYNYSLPVNFTDPNLSIVNDSFTDTRTAPVGGVNFGITLSGTVSADQHSIADSVSFTLNGTYNGVFLSGTIYATGTLIAPYVPTITGTAANQATTDTATIKPFQNVVVGDQNPGTITATVTLSSTGNGTLSNLGGGTYNSTTGIYTITGNQASVTSALEGLVFTPAQHLVQPGQSLTTNFSIQVSDTSGGIAFNNSTSIISTEVGPYISGTQNGQTTLDVNPVTPFHNVTITDTYAGTTDTVTITLSAAANGTLTNLGGGSYNTGTGVYTVSGTVAQVTSALDGLVFNPTRGQAPAGQTVTTGFTIQVGDSQGVSISNGATSVITTETGMVITGGATSQSLTDFATISPLSSLVISDPDPTRVETVKITNYAPAEGTLSNLGTGTYDGGTGIYTVSGTAAQVTAAVQGLQFTAVHQNQFNPGQVYDDGLGVHVTNAASQTADFNAQLHITATGPTINGLSAAVQSTLDSVAISPFKTVVITDPNPAAVETAVVSLTSVYGLPDGVLSNLGGGNYDAGTGSYTVTGTAAQVTAALQGLLFVPTYRQAYGGQVINTGFSVSASNAAGGYSGALNANIAVTETGPALTLSQAFQGGNAQDLARDAAGDVFGTTTLGGTNNLGSVFEVLMTATGLGTSATTLFNATYSQELNNDVIVDAGGNVLGTISYNSNSNPGSVFEITKTAGGFSSTLTTLVTFDASQHVSPRPGLVADANGNLFGATAPGASTPGTVFEIAKTAGGYASTATTLYSFSGATDGNPYGNLFVDANGNLFGTTSNGGANGDGTIFEIAKTAGGYAATLTVLASFSASTGKNPSGNLIMDAAGNIYGTTIDGSPGDGLSDPNFMLGTLYELAKTPGGYASTPSVVVDFGVLPEANVLNWGGPYKLAIDNAGNIFGEATGGPYGGGKIFELAKSTSGYSAPTVVYNFQSFFYPSGLTVDAAGNFYGTAGSATGGANVFELRHTGFHAGAAALPASDFNGDGESDLVLQNSDGALSVWSLSGSTVSNAASIAFNPGTSWHVVGSGDFNRDSYGDILWQDSSGQAAIWEMNGATPIVQAVAGNNADPTWHVKATGDFNADGYSDILWQSSSTDQVAIWEMNGTTPIVQTLIGGNSDPAWKVIGAGDFNGDGYSDILFQNASGQAAIWLVHGTTATSSTLAGVNPGPTWHIAGIGDFNGDGDSDLVWQNSNGQVAIWLMNGTTPTSQVLESTNPGPAMHIVGTGDVNGDGDADIQFQNADTGQVTVWLMNGASVLSQPSLGSSPGTAWNVANDAALSALPSAPHARDFNGDGVGDLLWQNTNGQAAIWELNASTPTLQTVVGNNTDTSWQVRGSGDFNGDGDADILWQNTNGQVWIWQMNGATPTAQTAVGNNSDPAWKVIGTGDFNGDGKADILWQNSSGQAEIWQMNGATVTSSAAVGPNPGTSWKVIGAGDFNGDGKADILWQNTNGQAAIWTMDGTTVLSTTALSLNPGSTWTVVGSGDFDGDGKSDILWQNSNGQVAIWEMNGTNPTVQTVVGSLNDPTWKVTGAEDVNGDGKTDILFQNTVSGQAAVWLMNGTNVTNIALIASSPTTAWHLVTGAGA